MSTESTLDRVSQGLQDMCASVRRRDIAKIRGLLQAGTSVNPPPQLPLNVDHCPFLIAAGAGYSPREIGPLGDSYEPSKHDYWAQNEFQRQAEINKSILTLLVENGAILFPLRSIRGTSSIHMAAFADNTNALHVIVEHHPEAANYSEDHSTPTPLEVAAKWGSYQTVKALLVCGGVEWRCTSPFELALADGHTRTAKELISYIPERFSLPEKHRTAFFEMLRWSVVDNQMTSFKALTKYLPNRRPNPSDTASFEFWLEKEKVLKKCFGEACAFASMDMIKLVFGETETLDINKDGVVRSFGFVTPSLLYAAEKGKFELAEFCLRVGADPFIRERGQTPLKLAKQRDDMKLLNLLKRSMEGNYSGQFRGFMRKLTG